MAQYAVFANPTSPDTLHAKFVAACEDGDIDALVALYEPDATIRELNGERTIGTEPIRDHIERLLAMKPNMEILSSHSVVSGDLAVSSSHWRAEATAPDGSVVNMEFRGAELTRRQADGTWLIVIDNPFGSEVLQSA